MPKPYSLNLYSPVIGAAEAFTMPLTPHVKGWRRSFRALGGCWQGSFYNTAQTPGDIKGIKRAFEEWLGYHVLEKVGGLPTWSGLIYEMDLCINGITRRRTLDLMANRIKTTYLTLDYVGDNFVRNNSYELYTGVGAPMEDFYSWYENVGTNGVITRVADSPAPTVPAGASCINLAADSDDMGGDLRTNTWARQNIEVTPGARYRITLWTKGDGVHGNGADNTGRWGVNDPNGAQWPVMMRPTYWGTATWKPLIADFTGPSDGEIQVFVAAPHNYDAAHPPYARFDYVIMLEEAQCVYETTWAHLEDGGGGGPISRYGVKEEIIHLDNYPEATSIAYRDTYLAEHGWPWPRPVTVTDPGDARLDVFVAGYVHTMNWLYVMEGDGVAHDVDDWIAAIVGADFGRSTRHGGDVATAGDCQFVRAGNIQANTLQVPQLTGVEERPWDVIQELVSLGDANGNPWHAAVGQDRRFHYMPVNTTPRYFIRKDGIYDTMAGNSPANPWTMVPGVFRDMTYRSNQQEPGSFLLSAQDMWAEEVEMADGWARPKLKTALFSETELLSARTERGE